MVRFGLSSELNISEPWGETEEILVPLLGVASLLAPPHKSFMDEMLAGPLKSSIDGTRTAWLLYQGVHEEGGTHTDRR